MSLEMAQVPDIYLMMCADSWRYTRSFQSAQLIEHANLDFRV